MAGRIYRQADAEVRELLDAVISKHHPDLAAVEARISVLMVLPPTNKDGEPTGPAVLHHGTGAVASIAKVSRKDRVTKKFDAEIQIDQIQWEGFEKETQRAVLDHELTHLVVRHDRDGKPMQDDDLRPVLALKPDDWVLTGFRCVVDRHGEHAVEAMALRKLYDQHGQALFPWAVNGPDTGGACFHCGKTGVTLTTLKPPGRKATPPVCGECFKAAADLVGGKRRRTA